MIGMDAVPKLGAHHLIVKLANTRSVEPGLKNRGINDRVHDRRTRTEVQRHATEDGYLAIGAKQIKPDRDNWCTNKRWNSRFRWMADHRVRSEEHTSELQSRFGISYP